MTDPLISEYLPIVQGHVVNRYKGYARRQHCLVSMEDLMQVAAIELVLLTADWPQICEERGDVEGDGKALFWSYLVTRVKSAVLRYVERTAHMEADSGTRRLDIVAEDGQNEDEVRTSLFKWRDPSLLQQEIADYYGLLPTRHKALIALRYFDELTFSQVADILSATEKTTGNLTHAVVDRWRAFARNQWVTHPDWLPAPASSRWTIPESFELYVQARYRTDVHTYLGYFAVCLKADVSYLTQILGRSKTVVPGSAAHSQAFSPAQQAQVDARLAAGELARDIAADMGVHQNTVYNHAKRRRAP